MLRDDDFKKSIDIINVNNLIKQTGEKIEGNCVYKHDKTIFEEFEPGLRYNNKLILRNNLFKIAEKSKNIVEIGLNGGHSASLYFYANPNIKLLSFDICSHKYVEPVAEYLISKYNLEFIKGNSLIEVPKYNNTVKYDAIHIDGGHEHTCVINDLINCKKFAHNNTLLIFDDSNANHINIILENNIKLNIIKEINYEEYELEKCYFHRIFKYCL